MKKQYRVIVDNMTRTTGTMNHCLEVAEDLLRRGEDYRIEEVES